MEQQTVFVPAAELESRLGSRLVDAGLETEMARATARILTEACESRRQNGQRERSDDLTVAE